MIACTNLKGEKLVEKLGHSLARVFSASIHAAALLPQLNLERSFFNSLGEERGSPSLRSPIFVGGHIKLLALGSINDSLLL
jgi:hypothetical protein